MACKQGGAWGLGLALCCFFVGALLFLLLEKPLTLGRPPSQRMLCFTAWLVPDMFRLAGFRVLDLGLRALGCDSCGVSGDSSAGSN